MDEKYITLAIGFLVGVLLTQLYMSVKFGRMLTLVDDFYEKEEGFKPINDIGKKLKKKHKTRK